MDKAQDEIERLKTEDCDPLITVCSVCLQASCWQGEFMCDDAQGAGTRELRMSKLAALNLEHSDYWKRDPSYKALTPDKGDGR